MFSKRTWAALNLNVGAALTMFIGWLGKLILVCAVPAILVAGVLRYQHQEHVADLAFKLSEQQHDLVKFNTNWMNRGQVEWLKWNSIERGLEYIGKGLTGEPFLERLQRR